MRALARFRMNRENEIMGFLLLSLAAILFLSLASYDPMDTPTYTSAPNAPAHNAVGVV
ncbi:MAG: DNA translocase FtsK 4TM domain-containing protein, partial [Candidatus Hydrogenedentota bacterium]